MYRLFQARSKFDHRSQQSNNNKQKRTHKREKEKELVEVTEPTEPKRESNEIRRRTAAPASQQQQQQKFTEQINIIMTTRALALTLYRNLMKQATTMSDYNFRSYAIRRVRVGYQKNRTVTGYVYTKKRGSFGGFGRGWDRMAGCRSHHHTTRLFFLDGFVRSFCFVGGGGRGVVRFVSWMYFVHPYR